MPMTNAEFGRRVGCNHSTASRLRSGDRLPSVGLMSRISEEFGIPVKTLVEAHQAGPESFSALLRRRVFRDPDPAPVA